MTVVIFGIINSIFYKSLLPGNWDLCSALRLKVSLNSLLESFVSSPFFFHEGSEMKF